LVIIIITITIIGDAFREREWSWVPSACSYTPRIFLWREEFMTARFASLKIERPMDSMKVRLGLCLPFQSAIPPATSHSQAMYDNLFLPSSQPVLEY
jgi:hypothetical protein